jgi:dipeptidyl aminopeptidase/acylaminoacyl peptidase
MPKTPARRLISPDDLLQFQWLSDPQISPDGSRILFTRKTVGEKNAYENAIWIADGGRTAKALSSAPAPQPFTHGPRDGHPRWSADGRRVAFIRASDKSKPQIHVIPATGGEGSALTTFDEGSLASFRWAPDGKSLAVMWRAADPEWTEAAKKERDAKGLSAPPRVIDDPWYRLDGDGYFNSQRYALYLVDASTGKARTIFDRDALGQFSYDFSPDSRHLVVSANTDKRALFKHWLWDLYRIDLPSGKIVKIPGLPVGAKTGVVWSPDGSLVAFAGREGVDGSYGTENLELWACDPFKGGGRSLTAKSDYCTMAATLSDSGDAAFAPQILWSGDSKRILFRLGWHGEAHVASVPRKGGAVQLHTSGGFEHFFGSISADGSRFALLRSDALNLPEVFVAKVASTMTPTAVTALNKPLLSQLKLSKPTSSWQKTADGTRVQTWTLRPPHLAASKKTPGLLLVHGGPHAQYGVTFFHEFQCLAATGYTVVFSNPRGSKGYGRDHCAAIRGAWGTADWVDIEAVIEFMQNHPAIDRKRLGIAGGSYGGYMTNWAIGHTKAFKAAITDRCVSNLISMCGSSDYPEIPDHYWPGAPWQNPEQMWESSPIKHFKGVRTPTLIIHSEGDLRCNVEQAEQVHAALCVQKVPCRFVRYPSSTSHGLSRGGPADLRLHRLRQNLAWWKKWL